MSTRILFGAGLALVLLSTAEAQRRPPGGGQLPGKEMSLDGTIRAVAGTQIQMTTNTNMPWMVGIFPQTKIELNGAAEASFLKPRMCVEFVADVAKDGKTKDKIGQMTIFTPNANRQLGLYPESAAGGPKKEGEDGPALGPDPGLAPEPAAKPGRKTRSKKGGNDGLLGGAGGDPFGITGGGKASQGGNIQLPAVCTVRGQIKSVHADSLSVSPGKGPLIRIDLADGALIAVELSDTSAAMPGDSITVKGRAIEQRRMIYAESVKIQPANPLSGRKRTTKPGIGKVEKTTIKRGTAKKGEAEAPALEEPKDKPTPLNPDP